MRPGFLPDDGSSRFRCIGTHWQLDLWLHPRQVFPSFLTVKMSFWICMISIQEASTCHAYLIDAQKLDIVLSNNVHYPHVINL